MVSDPAFSVQRQGRFLKALARTGSVTAAVRAAGVPFEVADRRRSDDESFARRWANAEQQAIDALEAEARRRAVEGVDEPVFYQGRQTGTVRKYSDALLSLLLKARRPGKFVDREDRRTGSGERIVVKLITFEDDS